MMFHLSIVGRDANSEKLWAEKLSEASLEVFDARVTGFCSGGELGQLVFVDSSLPDLHSRLEQIDRKGRAVILILDEAAAPPALLGAGKVDDVLIYPFRPLELLGKI